MAIAPAPCRQDSDTVCLRAAFSGAPRTLFWDGLFPPPVIECRHSMPMARRKLLLYPRKQLDIRWRDLAAGMLRCVFPGDSATSEAQICRIFAPDRPVLTTFAVRAGFDLFLKAQGWPAGSEILMSALTIREMADIVRKHRLVPVPLDLNLGKLAPEGSAVEATIKPQTRAHVLVKLFTIPLLYGLFYRVCVSLEKDFDQVINAVRNLPPEDEEEDLALIRKQPSGPLLALLLRRLRTFSTQRLRERREVGRQFARGLPTGITFLGAAAPFHSYWVFPVLVEAPERFAAALRTYGFDATTAGSALSVAASPPGEKFPAADNLRTAYRNLLYLPVYPEVPPRARARLQSALHEIQKETPHLH